MNGHDLMAMLGASPTPQYAEWNFSSPTKSRLLSYIRTNWSQDVYSYGSYSYLAAGSGNRDRETLLEPIGDRVYFAGEALNPNYQSSVLAAYESGLTAAEAIISSNHNRIAIIGAGMCGLTAAQLLAANRKDVLVLEGRSRIGGRIWTDRSFGTTVDVGATWIHGPNGNPISELADRAGLSRIPTDDNSIIRGNGGRRILGIFAPKWLLDVSNQTPTGTELDKLNMHETEKQFKKYGYGYEGRDVKFPNGYDQIFQSLQGDYEVRLSSIVDRVAYSDDGVEIGIQNKDLLAFDAVIVTVPLGVLKRETISFEPPLSSEKRAAISRMGMGTLDKLYLLFEEAFWDEDATIILTPENDLPQGHFNYWVNFKKYLNKPILMAFNAGEAAHALGKMPDIAIVEQALNTLAIAYPS